MLLDEAELEEGGTAGTQAMVTAIIGSRGHATLALVDDLVVERVLRAVECVPPGQVATYGQIGAVVGIGARQVGRILAVEGAPVPWWRVVNARGRFPSALALRALSEWRREGTPIDEGVPAVRIGEARVEVGALARAWRVACADLPPEL
ncbi:MAG: MGMT family protein [Actinomyces sp.]|jgi:alkylated DNA nucleotide flippase Atl1|nr:MGMT family protein [Actinomyces sp.]MCI1789035.1 MGMT family protein [Actinomyces sp.]